MKVPYMILLWQQLKYALAIAVLAILPLGFACNRAAPAAAEQPVPKVTVSAVVSGETIDADEYTGQTEASEIVEVRARVFGYLKSIEFKDGDYVKEGQVVRVKVLEADDKGRLRLSMKAAAEDAAAPPPSAPPTAPAEAPATPAA